jgi:hypothetical protein
MRIGDVLSEAWGLYKRFFGQFFLTALVVFVVLDLLAAVVDNASGNNTGANLFWALLGALISVIGYFWVQAALIETARDVRDGRADRSIGETYVAVRPRLPSAIIAGILAAIGIGIGLILLIIPGLFLLTIWSMVIPVVVIESRSAGEAFSRSREVVRGNGWSVLGLIIVVFLLVAITSIIVRLIFSPLPNFIEVWLGSLLADSLTVPFAAAALTTAYFKLVGTGQEAHEPGASAAVL